MSVRTSARLLCECRSRPTSLFLSPVSTSHARLPISVGSKHYVQTSTRTVSLVSPFASRSFMGFFRRNKDWQGIPDSMQCAIDAFHTALDSGDKAAIKKVFTDLIREVECLEVPPPKFYLTFLLKPITAAVRALSRSSQYEDTQYIIYILNSVKTPLGLEPGLVMHQHLLQAMASCRRPLDGLQWLRNMHRDYPDVRPEPGIRAWSTVLDGFADLGDSAGLRMVMDEIRQQNPIIQPTVVTYNILLRGLFEAATRLSKSSQGLFSAFVDREEIAGILAEMFSCGIEPDALTLRILLSGYAKAGMMDEARSCALRLTALVEEFGCGTPEDTKLGNALVWFEGLESGLDGAREKLAWLKRHGMVPNEYTAGILLNLQANPTVSDLRALEESFGVRGNTTHWSLLIKAAARRSLKEGLALYDEARANGIEPDVITLQSLINAVILDPKALGSLTAADVNRAVDIYRGYSSSARGSPQRLDANLYNSLLQAIVNTLPPSKTTSELILELLGDMQNSSIMFDGSTFTALSVMLIRSATSHQAAFNMYERLRNIGDTMLDADGYTAIFAAFCNLAFVGTPVAPRDLCFRILMDMREAGHPASCRVYTILLHRYAALASNRSPTSSTDPDYPALKPKPEILDHVRRTHTAIKLDAAVIPDAALLNALMNAYSYSGAYLDALEVWDELSNAVYATSFNHISVSIALDACGFGGLSRQSDEIWTSVRESGFPLNKKNWDTRVENLARLGRFDEALRIVFEDMGGKDPGIPEPDLNTVGILLKFSWRFERREEVKAAIQSRLPDLYSQLTPEILQSKNNA
ncbi:hypothetical protein BOTBODRAFT_62607 [Botryobasidium botryosum FD-172 SS1]|uniref:Pentacotripeptide-repeat region of PRORP domain-containing protein n=1 Tax=Botryobasidium botryosum (strain FD-172 SS1) TaxID=930990 RepID=A0A067N868_BOTB1|nr:hypothetical protein BOTBODRAFT_62607 [Botryobasidium botryosum FD-172 SS1]